MGIAMKIPVFRVFVSSTWRDLQPERKAVEEVLHRLRETKFVGMEYFGSKDETTEGASLEEVDCCDLYLGIFGGLYSSGITAKEYRRARKKGLNCLIYLKDKAAIPKEYQEKDKAKAKQLNALKRRLRRNHTVIPAFRTPNDLAAIVGADLHNWLATKRGASYNSLLRIYLVNGITALGRGYDSRIDNFLAEYLGSAEHPVPFGGRDAELTLLNDWLFSPGQPPYLFLGGSAGRGKSALLVRWSRMLLSRDDVAVIFFPVSIRFRTNLASIVFGSLTARLAHLHGEQVPGTPDTSVEVWRGMLTDYLTRPLPDGRTLLLILDGVDEAGDWEAAADLFPIFPPERTRVLLSARYRPGDVDGNGWLARLGWQRRGLACSIDLPGLTPEGVSDVLKQMGFPLARLGKRVDIVMELHRLSEADPLLVRLYVEDLWTRGALAARLRPEDLRTIRPGLEGYFARWWYDQRCQWEGSKKPLLRDKTVHTLLDLISCSMGPLSRDDLLEVAPPEIGLTSRVLPDVLDPIGRFVIGDGRSQGYAFGHPRLGSYFYEQLTENERGGVESRFLDWGRRTLKGLSEGRIPAEKASPYIVQYYGAHLVRAKASTEELLSLVCDGWRKAWYSLEGAYSGFLTDVQRAWDAAGRTDEDMARNGEQAIYLGQELRCALCLASVNSLARNIPPVLLLSAVRMGAWTPMQGLAYARLKPQSRTETLAGLAPHLPEPLRSTALREEIEAAGRSESDHLRVEILSRLMPTLPEPLLGDALALARAIEDKGARSKALTGLVQYLPKPLRSEAVQEALVAIRAEAQQREHVRELVALAPHLRGSLRADLLLEILGRVLTIKDDPNQAPTVSVGFEASWVVRWDDYTRAEALVELMPCLPEPLRGWMLEEALKAARQFVNDKVRSRVLARLSCHLSEPLRSQVLEETLAMARAIDSKTERRARWKYNGQERPLLRVVGVWGGLWIDIDPNVVQRAETLAQMLPYCSEQRLGDVLLEALALARKVFETDKRAETLAQLLPYCSEQLLGDVLLEALAAARATQNPVRVRILSGLVPCLPEPLLEEAFALAQESVHEGERAYLLALLAPRLSEPLLGKALTVARGIRGVYERAEALVQLVPRLPEPLKGVVVQEALAALRATGNEFIGRPRAMAELASDLPELQRDVVLREALTTVKSIRDHDGRAEALAGIIRHLPESLLGDALELARGVTDPRVLIDLLPRLPEPFLLDALVKVREIYWEDIRVEWLTALAPHLSQPLLGGALLVARGLVYEYERVRAYRVLASYLPEPQRSAVLIEAFEVARGMREEFWRRRALALLAPDLSVSPHAKLLMMSWNSGDVDYRAQVIADFAQHLPEPLLEEALAALRELGEASERTEVLSELTTDLPFPFFYETWRPRGSDNERHRANALVALAPRLPEPLLGQALTAARALVDERRRANVLVALAPRLPEPLLGEALTAARTLVDERRRANALVALAPRLPEPKRKQALAETLAAARKTADAPDRARALSGLAPHLAEPPLAEAIAALRDSQDYYWQAEILIALAPCLSESLLGEALTAACEIDEKGQRAEALAALTSHIPDSLLGEALTAARALVDERRRANVLVALAPRLPEPLLGQALTAARALVDENHRANALVALAPRLPEPLLGQALTAARTLVDKNHRANALVALVPRLSEPKRQETLGAVFELARGFKGDDRGYARQTWGDAQRLLKRIVAALPPHVAKPLNMDVAEEMLAAVREITPKGDRTIALGSLAPCLPEPLSGASLYEALAAAREIGDEGELAITLSEIGLYSTGSLHEKAFEATQQIRDRRRRAEVLGKLALRLSEPLRSEAVKEALAAVREIPPVGAKFLLRRFERDERAEALGALLPYLPEPLLGEVLTLARELVDLGDGAQVLAALAPRIPEPLLGEVLTLARELVREGERADVLAALAPRLPEPKQSEMIRELLETASHLESQQERLAVLTKLAPHLPESLLERALTLARELVREGERADVLAALALRLPEPKQSEMIRELLETASHLESQQERLAVLTKLAPHLPESLLERALTVAETLEDDENRAQVMVQLVSHLPAALLERALTVAIQLRSSHWRVKLLVKLVTHFPKSQNREVLEEAIVTARAIHNPPFYEPTRSDALVELLPLFEELSPSGIYPLWRRMFDITAIRDRNELLGDIRALCPVIALLGGEKALMEVFQAIRDAGRWWP
jgi:hypothetical protein